MLTKKKKQDSILCVHKRGISAVTKVQIGHLTINIKTTLKHYSKISVNLCQIN